MKTPAVLALLMIAATVPLAASSGAIVFLDVTLGNHQAPSHKHCAVTVPAGATAAAVLDQAQADGCIDSWSYDSFEGFGRFVTCIDGLCQLPAGTFWAFYVDEQISDLGIDSHHAAAGQTIEFVYADWFTPFPPPV